MAKTKKFTLTDLKMNVNVSNSANNTQFFVGGAYGLTELWVTMPSGGNVRLECGSPKECYEFFLKEKYKEKYTFPNTEKFEILGA